MTLLLIIAALLGVAVLVRGGMEITSRKRYALPRSESNELSWASREILKGYNALPVESRPFPDIVRMLRALDVKYDKDRVNKHFSHADYDGTSMTWNCYCARDIYVRHRDNCMFQEYKDLMNSITGIRKAIAEREHALAIAAVNGDLFDVKELTERLREERKLIADVTKELT